jgi:hypothetical protein
MRKVILLIALLIAVSGCTRSDWIDRTLVTVEVTGTWEGSSAQGGSGEFRLSLEQQGAQVKGSIRITGNSSCYGALSIVGPIEGTVAGDVLSFKQTNASFLGQMTVSGDEMSGRGSSRCGLFTITLRRVTASSSPSVPKP